MKEIKKFDICLMNPPYGSGNNKIHLEFIEKLCYIVKKQIVLMPFSFIDKVDIGVDNKFNNIQSQLISVEEISSSEFKDTSMGNIGIYIFDINKKQDDVITIKYLNNQTKNIKSLSDKSVFSDYEKNIENILLNCGSNPFIGGRSGGYTGLLTRDKYDISDEEYNILRKNKIIQNCKKIKKYFSTHKHCVALTVAKALGGPGNTRYFTNNSGKIFSTYNDIEHFFIDAKIKGGLNILLFNDKKCAENCKSSLTNNIFKFILLRTQKDQNLTFHIYKYIPNIDWSDDRVRTDEGLLEVCGCPKDKIKEYAEYCKEIIKKVDNGERP